MGPMYAGKSTALLQQVRKDTEAGFKVLLIKPSLDTRYTSDSSVVTHSGQQLPCLSLPTLAALKDDPSLGIDYKAIEVLAIGEARSDPPSPACMRSAHLHACGTPPPARMQETSLHPPPLRA